MARVDFGYTWWGRMWLNALTHIDFDNRLPRGKRYARNGSVRSVDIHGPRVLARVKGSRPAPYKVSLQLPAVGSAERRSVVAFIRSNPYFLSQLQARRLPPELAEAMESRGIPLFPASWRDLKMSCSCPDWAVPCKHLAAVVYVIANEIDKNPFLVFELHGLDLLAELAADGLGSSGSDGSITPQGEIPTIESMESSATHSYRFDVDALSSIDLTRIENLIPSISRVLSDSPLFYPTGDFKALLLKAYEKLSKAATKHIAGLSLVEDPEDILFDRFLAEANATDHEFDATLTRSAPREAPPPPTRIGTAADMSPVVDYLATLSAGDLRSLPPVTAYLVMFHFFALRTVEMAATVPEIVAVANDRTAVRWIPALFDHEVRAIFDTFEKAMPCELLLFSGMSLTKREQLLFLFSIFVRHYIQIFSPVPKSGSDPILAAFFEGEWYVPKRFEDRENPQTIHLWLGQFLLRPGRWAPVIEIDEGRRGTFAFSIRVRDRTSEDELPEDFDQFLRRPEAETLPLLRDLALLGEHLETVNDFLRAHGPIEVLEEEFVERWFAALPAFRTLGVRSIVPKALRQVFLPHLAIRATAKTTADSVVSYTSLADMLNFDWTLAVGDRTVDPDEVLRLVESAGRYIRFQDTYVEVDEKQLDRVRKQLGKPPVLRGPEALAAGLSGRHGDAHFAMDDAAKSIIESLTSVPDVDVPEDLRANLRPYQLRGYRWLYHNNRIGLGSVVADDMGLGKTVQVIALLLQLKHEGVVGPKRPALAVVPSSVVTNWRREVERFAPNLTARIYHGTARTVPEDADLVITTYALVRIDESALTERRWSVAIIDEAQMIKNSASAQAKAVKSIRGKAGFAVALTGTPVENRLLDYWSIVDYCVKGYLGSRSSFKERYAAPIERFRDREALDRFRRLTAPLTLRRVKTDPAVIADLPEKIVVDRYPALTDEQVGVYEAFVGGIDEMMSGLEGSRRNGIVFKLMTGLKQICCHPRLYLKRGSGDASLSGKAMLLVQLLSSIVSAGEKALVFTQFAQMGELLVDIVEGALGERPLFLHGATTRNKRDEMVDAFQASPEHRVMILSIKAGGVGLNLTAATHVVHYDLWWNPAVENQATDRAFRIGQKRNVTVHRLITKGTFEEKINDILTAKQELAGLAVADGEAWLTKLSATELKELVSLSEG